jgi:hypothetical protein
VRRDGEEEQGEGEVPGGRLILTSTHVNSQPSCPSCPTCMAYISSMHFIPLVTLYT